MYSELYDYVVQKKHHAFRKDYPELNELPKRFARENLSPIERMTQRFELLTKLESPVLLEGERICFLRTVKQIPECFTDDEWEAIRNTHYIHERGYFSNLSPNYGRVIADGLLSLRSTVDTYAQRVIDAIIDLADRYRNEALKQGKTALAEVLSRVPRYGATSFYEALQFFRILHFSLWLEGNYHNTIGRFDQYMYPYLKEDLDKGVHTTESALELLKDFFLSFNKDSDLYVGVQQGDNGQSMMLGGIDARGIDTFNLLSSLCLEASRENRLIDPKINLRVSRLTPASRYIEATQLTKIGLGFPQYSNDDVVIPALEKLGYSHEDATNYTVAACWEFIIPYVGLDIPNIGAMSYPKAVDAAVHNSLLQAATFEDFFTSVKNEILFEADKICDSVKNVWFVPSPFMNALMDCNIHERGKYNNFGIHGTGIATAADSLAAIKKYIFEEKTVTKEAIIRAIDTDFADMPELLHMLRYHAPKLGNNDDYVDSIATELLDAFSNSLAGKTNCRGGVYRAGTGSAMFYLWHANEIGATPDGRRRGEPFGANYAVSLFAKVKGPVSVIASMTKQHFENAINGGPLTLEFHQSVFADDGGVEKVGLLVKQFIARGGHQLQLNAVNVDKLFDAQKNPENYRQMVVRIWGWSAYFVELDKEFQDHVIARQVYQI